MGKLKGVCRVCGNPIPESSRRWAYCSAECAESAKKELEHAYRLENRVKLSNMRRDRYNNDAEFRDKVKEINKTFKKGHPTVKVESGLQSEYMREYRERKTYERRCLEQCDIYPSCELCTNDEFCIVDTDHEYGICLNCGKRFLKTSRQEKYCSAKCRAQMHYRRKIKDPTD